MSDLAQLGQIGLLRTKGFSSWLIRTMTHSNWNHCVVYVGDVVDAQGNPHTDAVVSAEVEGVRILPAEHFQGVSWSEFDLTVKQQNKIIDFSIAQDGRPYGKFTYAWIGIAILLKIPTPQWLERRLNDGRTYICSQLAARAYQAAGVDLFADARPIGAVVSPGSLGKLFKDLGWVDKS